MSRQTTLLVDLSMLLELTLVPRDQKDVDQFMEDFLDRLLTRTFATNALFFVRSNLLTPGHAEGAHRDALTGSSPAEPASDDEHLTATPLRRAQYLLRAMRLDGRASGLIDVLAESSPRLRPGSESGLAHVALPGVELPGKVIQVPVPRVGVLEIYGGREDALDEHLGRVLGSLADWLAHQVESFAARAAHQARLEQLRTSQQWLEDLLDSLPGLVWHSDVHGRITYTNARIGPVLGRESLETFADLRSCVREADRSRVEHEIAEAIARKETLIVVDYQVRRRGEDVPAREIITFGFQADGGLVSRAGYIFTNTGGGTVGRASATSDPLFVDKLSHELRSPLFPVIALSDLLLQLDPNDLPEGEWQQHLELINASGKDLLALVDDLLELSRLGAGRSRVDVGLVDVSILTAKLKGKNDVELSSQLLGKQLRTDRVGLERIATALAAVPGDLGHANGRLELEQGDSGLVIRARIPNTVPSRRELDEWFEPFGSHASAGQERGVGAGLRFTMLRESSLALAGECEARVEAGDLLIEARLPASFESQFRSDLELRSVLLISDELRDVVRLAIELNTAGALVRLVRSRSEAAPLLARRRWDAVAIAPGFADRAAIERAIESLDHPPLILEATDGDAVARVRDARR